MSSCSGSMSDIDFDAPPKARALVVLVHGFQGFKDWGFFPWLSEYLCASGCVSARFTVTGETYEAQVRNVVAAAGDAVSRFRGLPLFLLGHSLGGAISLIAAREIEALAGVITWSAIGDHADVIEAVSQLRAPLLAIHGANDKSVPANDSRLIAGRAPDASLLVIEGASHTYNAIHPLVHIPRALELAAVVSAHFVAAYA